MINNKTNKTEKEAMHGRYKTNSIESLVSAAQAGLGYLVTDLSVLDKNIAELGLKPLLQNYTFPENIGSLYAVYPHRNQTQLVKKFLETVQEVMGTPPIWESYLNTYR